MTWNKLQTHVTPILKAELTVFMIFQFFANDFTHSLIFLPIQSRFYLSKWQVYGSLCKAMYVSDSRHKKGVKT